ncbi:MAG: hypothetical protein HPZ91_01745 [Lentisphaeria bacterium]|nr:hypothetical protein [Lentisphaeria bacterium]
MKMRFLPVLLFFFAALLGAAEPEALALYPWRKILTRGAGDGALGAFRVDRDLAVKGAAHPNTAVFTPDGREIPSRFEPVMVPVAQKFMRPLGLASKPHYSTDRTPGVVFDNPSRTAVDAVELRTAERDFDKLVRIEAGEDGVNFRPVAADRPFYDYSRAEAECRVISFPPVSARYLRIRVMDYPEEVQPPGVSIDGGLIPGGEGYARRRIRIDRFVALSGEEKTVFAPLVTVEEPLESVRREEGGRTVAEGRFEPEGFRSLRSEIVSKELFARGVEFYGSMDGKKYLFLGRLVQSRLSCDGGAESIAVLPVDGRRFPYYRLVVDNGGRPPLDEVRLRAGSERSDIVFESGEPLLILAYGSQAASVRPESRGRGETIAYSAGPEEPNPAYATGGINWMRWILVAVVGAMMVVLFYLLWQGYQSIVK